MQTLYSCHVNFYFSQKIVKLAYYYSQNFRIIPEKFYCNLTIHSGVNAMIIEPLNMESSSNFL